MDEKHFNKRLRELRKEKNLTQGQVAYALGIKLNTYAHMEKDGKRPSADMLKKLSELFFVSIDDLTGINNQPPLLEGLHTEKNTLVFKSDENVLGVEFKKHETPMFIKDMHSAEQDIILMYRMMSEEDKQKVNRYVKRTFEKKDK